MGTPCLYCSERHFESKDYIECMENKITASRARAQDLLSEWWKSLRDGMGHERSCLRSALSAASALLLTGVITDTEYELWKLRFEKQCPGHNDEGGRSWCAYCGDMKSEEEGP